MDSTLKLIKYRRLIPTTLITLGSIMIANVAWPILYYQFMVSPTIRHETLLSPVSSSYLSDVRPENVAESREQPGVAVAQVKGQTDTDYTKASVWFPTTAFVSSHTSKITHYTISIPKLDIEDAVVTIGGEDLAKSLIQYPGTAYPGEPGSPVIFGHSVLRQFYYPERTNPRRYLSIFSKIMTLKEGDTIQVDFDGIEYRYVVKNKLEVKPEDVGILTQFYDNRQLKLITCVPEGTYLRRGVVIAQLQDVN